MKDLLTAARLFWAQSSGISKALMIGGVAILAVSGLGMLAGAAPTASFLGGLIYGMAGTLGLWAGGITLALGLGLRLVQGSSGASVLLTAGALASGALLLAPAVHRDATPNEVRAARHRLTAEVLESRLGGDEYRVSDSPDGVVLERVDGQPISTRAVERELESRGYRVDVVNAARPLAAADPSPSAAAPPGTPPVRRAMTHAIGGLGD